MFDGRIKVKVGTLLYGLRLRLISCWIDLCKS